MGWTKRYKDKDKIKINIKIKKSRGRRGRWWGGPDVVESAPRALDVMSWSRLADHSIMEIMTKMMMMLMMMMMMVRGADALRASGCNELVTLARPCPPGGVNTAQDGDHYHDDEIHHDDGD